MPPTDPAAFVAQAERLTNEGTVDEALAIYAPDAVVDTIVDGARDVQTGREAIRASLAAMVPAARGLGVRISKTLVAADGDTIVARWEGRVGSREGFHGMESFRLRDDGLVVEHRLYGYFDVRPATGPVAGLRLLVTNPKVALALLRAQRAAGRG